MSVLTRPEAPITVEATTGDKPPLDYRIWDVTGDYCLFNENGEPVPQNPNHYKAQESLENMVASLLHDRPEWCWYQDVLLAWDEDNPDYWCAPDLAVFSDEPVTDPDSGVIQLWETSAWPIFVLEVISPKSEFSDEVRKRDIYEAQIRVPEYVIHSPKSNSPYLHGYRMVSGQYEAMEPDEHGRIWSEQLRGWFGLDEQGKIRVWDASGCPAVKIGEAIDQRDAETRRADEATRRAEEQAQRADDEARLRAAAEKELRELRALLEQQSEG